MPPILSRFPADTADVSIPVPRSSEESTRLSRSLPKIPSDWPSFLTNLLPSTSYSAMLSASSSLLLGSSLFSLRRATLLHRLVEILGSRGYSASADRGSSLLLLTCRLLLCSLHACARITSLSLLHRGHLVVAHVHQLPVLHVVCTRSGSRSRLLQLFRRLGFRY